MGFEKKGDDYRLEVGLPEEFAHLVVMKGSICISGISLTVAGIAADRLTVWIIPHTREHTHLAAVQVGDLVNLEFDLLAKYVERIVGRTQPPTAQYTDRDLS